MSHNPIRTLADEIERFVFTAARNWERRVTIHHADRDAIVKALRRGNGDICPDCHRNRNRAEVSEDF